MNRSDPLTDELIQAVFERRARRASPDGLRDDILGRTVVSARRSAWRTRISGALSVRVPRVVWVALLVVATLLGIAVALLTVGQSRRGPLATGTLAFVRHGDVYLAAGDGSNPKLALHRDGTQFLTVAWSPDGARLAIEGDSGVVILTPATGAAVSVQGYEPAWSHDGESLAVLDRLPSTADPNTAIRIIDAASLTTRSTYPFAAVGGLAWSPNGRWIAASGAQDVLRIDVATGAQLEIVGPSGHLDSPKHVTWSPDSLHLAYVQYDRTAPVADCSDSESCGVDVFVADPDGGHPIRVNALADHADLPSWSPDGQWLAYREVNRTKHGSRGVIGLHVAHPDGTGDHTIIQSAVVGYSWNAGSDQLVYAVSGGPAVVGQFDPAWAAPLWITTLDGVTQPLGISVDEISPPSDGTIETLFAWQSLAVSR